MDHFAGHRLEMSVIKQYLFVVLLVVLLKEPVDQLKPPHCQECVISHHTLVILVVFIVIVSVIALGVRGIVCFVLSVGLSKGIEPFMRAVIRPFIARATDLSKWNLRLTSN